ncbi:transposon Ty3-I Gag-Pol polyprotein [Trichonephila clavata]|uniref:Transposon Ty3-I Gag-Pol polyprotein n=1 Tax=Trichonephila clavata TaxID=2740835 RepID=A0A8X6HLY9_TRICU|nr:transposon Ty3-I Gag-Pol polyprotein [Trichonephila clavata]
MLSGLSPNKCLFAAREIKVLGHLVSGNGVCPNPDKVKSESSFPISKNIRDMRSFLGLCSYFRRFIKGFSYLAEPLQLLLKGDAKFQWGSEEIESFESPLPLNQFSECTTKILQQKFIQMLEDMVLG